MKGSASALSILAVLAWYAPAYAQAPASVVASSYDSAGDIAATVYYMAAVVAAMEDEADAALRTKNARINDLETQLAGAQASGAAASALRQELAELQKEVVTQLAEKDVELARQVEAFRGAVQDIAATPEGAAILASRKPGNLRQARELLIELDQQMAAAEEKAKDIRRATRLRSIAIVALDDRDRGEATTDEVIERFVQVTRMDPGNPDDWLQLAQAYRETKRYAESASAARHGLEAHPSDRQKALLQLELGLTKAARSEADAYDETKAASESLKALAAAARNDLSLQQNYIRSLYLLADQADYIDETERLHAEAMSLVRSLLTSVADDVPLRLAMLEVFRRNVAQSVEQEDLKKAVKQIQDYDEMVAALESAPGSQSSMKVTRAIADERVVNASLWDRIGNGRRAHQELSEAVARYDRILAEDPANADVKGDLAKALLQKADINLRTGVWAEDGGGEAVGVADLERSIKLRRELARDETDVRAQVELIVTLVAISPSDFKDKAERARAEARIEEGLALGRKLPPGAVEVSQLFAFANLRRADDEISRGNLGAAISALEEALVAFRKSAAASPDDLDSIRNVQFALLELARRRREVGQREIAATLFETALKDAEGVAAKTYATPGNRLIAANMFLGLGMYLVEAGETARAKAMFDRNFAIREQVALGDAGFYTFLDEYAAEAFRVADKYLDAGKREDASALLERAVATYRRAVDQPTATVGDIQGLNGVIQYLEQFYLAQGNTTKAGALITERLSRIRKLKEIGELYEYVSDLSFIAYNFDDPEQELRLNEEGLVVARSEFQRTRADKWAFQLGMRLNDISLLHLRSKRPMEALAAAEDALANLRPIVTGKASSSLTDLYLANIKAAASAAKSLGNKTLRERLLQEALPVARRTLTAEAKNTSTEAIALLELVAQDLRDKGELRGARELEALSVSSWQKVIKTWPSNDQARTRFARGIFDRYDECRTAAYPECPTASAFAADFREALTSLGPLLVRDPRKQSEQYAAWLAQQAWSALQAEARVSNNWTSFEQAVLNPLDSARAQLATAPNDRTLRATYFDYVHQVALRAGDRSVPLTVAQKIFDRLTAQLETLPKPDRAEPTRDLAIAELRTRWVRGWRDRIQANQPAPGNSAKLLAFAQKTVADIRAVADADANHVAAKRALIEAMTDLGAINLDLKNQASHDMVLGEALKIASDFSAANPGDPERLAIKALIMTTPGVPGVTLDDSVGILRNAYRAEVAQIGPGLSTSSMLIQRLLDLREIKAAAKDYEAAAAIDFELLTLLRDKLDVGEMDRALFHENQQKVFSDLAVNQLGSRGSRAIENNAKAYAEASSARAAAAPDRELLLDAFEAALLVADLRVLVSEKSPTLYDNAERLLDSAGKTTSPDANSRLSSQRWRLSLRKALLDGSSTTWAQLESLGIPPKSELGDVDEMIIAAIKRDRP